MSKKKIVDVLKDKEGVITHYKFEGNSRFTNKEIAVEMAENDKIEDVNISKSSKGNKYLRTNPDKNKSNNLDNL